MTAPARPFRLTRYFSLLSLAGVVAVLSCLIVTYRDLAEQQLIEHESRANANLTQAFANTVWSGHRDWLLQSIGRSAASLRADPAQATLRAEVLRTMGGLPIAKVKIYNLDGLTVFSTDERQIGEDKRGNAGFATARAGTVASTITYRERVDAFEGTWSNRNLIASYVPVSSVPQGPTEGVFEVYSDVTGLLAQQRVAQWRVAGLVLGLLTLLYGFLHLVVRKADRIIGNQEREREQAAEALRHQAYHDALTGLPNRTSFAERLGDALALASRHQHRCALLFIDLDRFKLVNDSLGHPAGDQLLQEVASRLRRTLRAGDQLFRMGGDEFCLILPEIGAPADAERAAQRVIDAMKPAPSIEGQPVGLGATVGIAVFPGDGTNVADLLKHADVALYIAKDGGRGRHAFYGTALVAPPEAACVPSAATAP